MFSPSDCGCAPPCAPLLCDRLVLLYARLSARLPSKIQFRVFVLLSAPAWPVLVLMQRHGPLGEEPNERRLHASPTVFSRTETALAHVVHYAAFSRMSFPSLVVEVPLQHAELSKGLSR